MNAEQDHPEPGQALPQRGWLASALRALAFGIAIFAGVFLVGAVLSAISFASGSREPIGVVGAVLRLLEFIYRLPVCWLSAPFTPIKNLTEATVEIAFWGICAEVVFRYLRHGHSPSNRSKVA